MKNAALVLLTCCIPAVWVYKELEVIDHAVERATCEDSLGIEARRNQQLLSGGRFIRKLDKNGNSSYTFFVPPKVQKKASLDAYCSLHPCFDRAPR